MIIVKINEAEELYDLDERMETALKYIENTDLNALENGRYEIDGDNIYAIVQDYQTKSQSEGKWEAHKKYIDIQCVIKGKEKIGLVFACKKLDPETGKCTAYNRRALLCRTYPQEEIFMMGGIIAEECGFSFTPIESFEEVFSKVCKKKNEEPVRLKNTKAT